MGNSLENREVPDKTYQPRITGLHLIPRAHQRQLIVSESIICELELKKKEGLEFSWETPKNIFHIYSRSFAQKLLFLLLGIISIEIGKMEGMLFFISISST